MEQPVIVVAGESPPDEAGTAFAAGVAAATAAEATREAHDAEATAESAQDTAQAAILAADRAETEAIRAQVQAGSLDDRMDRVEAILDDLADIVAPGPAVVETDPNLPPKVTVEVETGNGGDDQDDDDKPKREPRRERTFGNPRWFRR